MKRNLQVVVNKVNVVVVSVVVVLVVLVTVVSSVRVIGMENISTGITADSIIAAAPETGGMSEIAGVVVVNLNGVNVPTHLQSDVVTPATSDIGRIHIEKSIARRDEINDSIAIAAIDQIAISDIRVDISSIDTAEARSIESIYAAPIYIGGCAAESIAQIDAVASQNIGDGNITDIAAASIIARSSNIERIS